MDGIPSALVCAIDERAQAGGRVLVAIEGPCAAGKTTLGAKLHDYYGCNVFSLDSFFLRPEQRTQARLDTPGGNIDYERARAELLVPLRVGVPFSYRPFDCARQALAAPVLVQPHAINIIEGVYSLHPTLADCYDLKVFLRIDALRQKKRLLARNRALYPRFLAQWLPLEALYFQALRVDETCDLILNTAQEDSGLSHEGG